LEHEIEIVSVTLGPFAENAYFVVDKSTKDAIAIDPGDESDRLIEIVRRHDWNVRYILNTHAHIEHVGAVEALKNETGAPFYLHETEQALLDQLPMQAAMFGLVTPPTPSVDGYLKEGDTFTFADDKITVSVTETPGHSPGGVTFRVGDVLIVGDTLFAGSIGRTDLPGGDHSTLIRSIREKLLVFPDETVAYPGHGPETTIGQERRTNPFLTDSP